MGNLLVVVIIFLLPGYIIYSMSRKSNYFRWKKERDDWITSALYTNFLSMYRSIFREKYGLAVEFYSKYDDPPFNTVLKRDHVFDDSTKFHDKYRRI